MNQIRRLFSGAWSILVVCALAFAMGGCEGDDGPQGPAGPQGPIGATGPAGADGADGAGAAVLPLESCGVCHSDGSFASAPAAHAVTGVPTISSVALVDAEGDLEISFNLLLDGVAADDFTTVVSAYIHTAADGLTNSIVAPITVVSDGGGDFTATIEGGTALAGDAARFFLRLANAADVRAVVSGDFPNPAFPDIVSDASCTNCHGPKGLAVHAAFGYPGMEASECVTCHKAEGGLPFLGFEDSWVGLVHGIHNAHSFPDGFYDYDGTVFDTTYPTYMTNCSVCHSEAPQLAAANAMPVTGAGCLSCHGSMEYAGWDFTGGLAFHLTNIADPLTHDCASQCHEPGGAAQSLVAVTDFHNGWVTGNDGVIVDGVDTSVVEGAKFDWAITSMVDDGVNLTFTWEASYDGVGVDPCNDTVGAGAPTFHLGDGGLRTYRSYAQGDDFIIGTSTSAPGQPSRANLDAVNTSCVGGVATTVIPVEAVAAEKGRIALGGKPLVISADVPDLVVEARVPSPTFDWLVGIGGAAPDRRAVVDNELCLSCHVGSLYQHGGDRVDNVDYCLICHNSASSEQNVRVGMGVDASEAYDGRVGETYELKTMLHRIHSAGAEGQPTYLVYRNRGIYAFGPDESVIPNWPGTGQQVVFGSDPAFTTNHNFHAPTYPRLLNDCTACHDADFAVIPNQASAMATTVEAGSDMWEDQLDDVLQGPGTTACVTCHAGSASKGHAYQNSWVPQAFPEGRDTIIDAGN